MRCVICGRGGQGVITLNYLLGNLASALGYETISAETHGMAMRGGSVYTTLKIGKAMSASIGAGEADLLLSTDSGEVERCLRFLSEKGVIITDGFYEGGPFEIINVDAGKAAAGKFGGVMHAGAILLGKTIARFPEIFHPEKSVRILAQNKKLNQQALLFGLGSDL